MNLEVKKTKKARILISIEAIMYTSHHLKGLFVHPKLKLVY